MRQARYASAFPALISNGGHQPGYLIGVAQETIPRVVETLVELEDIRHGGREVELRNRLVRNAFQVLDDAAQAVAVGDDQDGVVVRQRRQISHFQ